jgi:hypothetical protein
MIHRHQRNVSRSINKESQQLRSSWIIVDETDVMDHPSVSSGYHHSATTATTAASTADDVLTHRKATLPATSSHNNNNNNKKSSSTSSSSRNEGYDNYDEDHQSTNFEQRLNKLSFLLPSSCHDRRRTSRSNNTAVVAVVVGVIIAVTLLVTVVVVVSLSSSSLSSSSSSSSSSKVDHSADPQKDIDIIHEFLNRTNGDPMVRSTIFDENTGKLGTCQIFANGTNVPLFFLK